MVGLVISYRRPPDWPTVEARGAVWGFNPRECATLSGTSHLPPATTLTRPRSTVGFRCANMDEGEDLLALLSSASAIQCTPC